MTLLGALAAGWLLVLLYRYRFMRWWNWWTWYSQIYLKSWHWKRVRRIKLFLGRNRCEVCGTKEQLEIHHLTYKWLWWELPWHLQILCHKHHEQETGLARLRRRK